MTLVHRVLYPDPVRSLEHYLEINGGAGWEKARTMSPEDIIEVVTESGLRGRGGAGFPTGRKWQTVAANDAGAVAPTTVVVNGAEGEPGTFKDRTILANNPYQVVEGALIAARAVGADMVLFGLKASFRREVGLLRAAADEITQAGWAPGIRLEVFEGPTEYLYGEETALLEAIDGRHPFPRIAPPFRRGVREVVETGRDVETGSGSAAHVEMAGPTADTVAPPTLVNNVETMANVARIVARGAAWFRTEGTAESPGTIVCTVSGDTIRAGVGEVLMGTPLREVIDALGGGMPEGRRIRAVLSGVANAVITEDQLDTPVSYEGMAAAGSGLGSAGFMVFGDRTDMVAVAGGVSRFLAVESCGQCSACKQDGLRISDAIDALLGEDRPPPDTVDQLQRRLQSVADGARCFLANQHQTVVGSVLTRFRADFDARLRDGGPARERVLVAELRSIADGIAEVDPDFRRRQPDWTYGEEYSGKWPAELFDEHRAEDGA